MNAEPFDGLRTAPFDKLRTALVEAPLREAQGAYGPMIDP
jgi:hypothetical protein